MGEEVYYYEEPGYFDMMVQFVMDYPWWCLLILVIVIFMGIVIDV